MKNNKIPELLVDDEGYPTKEWLNFIKNYKNFDEIPIKEFLELLRKSWWASQMLFVLHKKYCKERMLELHTGGWSGNEEIIHAILSNTVLINLKMKYIAWNIGGHYYFVISL